MLRVSSDDLESLYIPKSVAVRYKKISVAFDMGCNFAGKTVQKTLVLIYGQEFQLYCSRESMLSNFALNLTTVRVCSY